MRVLISVSRNSPYWSNAWESSEEVIIIALRLIQENNLVPLDTFDDPSTQRFLAVERWNSRTYIVFDIFHHTYDPVKAHLPGQDNLPVITVFLSKKESASIAGGPIANKVNEEIRSLHDATGLGSKPPFFTDHANGKVPCYPNPRTCRTSIA